MESNSNLLADLTLFYVHCAETLDKVGVTLFPNTEHIMFLTNSLVIELLEVSVQDYLT